MPLSGNVKRDIHELMMDNKKMGKERGMNGKMRSHDQIVAIALSEARKRSKK